MSDMKEAMERRTDEAFAGSAWQDPRAAYRTLLRGLRASSPAAFEQAVAAYEHLVVQRLEDESADPVAAWLEYGIRLAELAGAGRTVAVDGAGRSNDITASVPTDADTVLLHLPADETAPALIVALPRAPTPAQQAAIALLADGAQALAD